MAVRIRSRKENETVTQEAAPEQTAQTSDEAHAVLDRVDKAARTYQRINVQVEDAGVSDPADFHSTDYRPGGRRTNVMDDHVRKAHETGAVVNLVVDHVEAAKKLLRRAAKDLFDKSTAHQVTDREDGRYNLAFMVTDKRKITKGRNANV